MSPDTESILSHFMLEMITIRLTTLYTLACMHAYQDNILPDTPCLLAAIRGAAAPATSQAWMLRPVTSLATCDVAEIQSDMPGQMKQGTSFASDGLKARRLKCKDLTCG